MKFDTFQCEDGEFSPSFELNTIRQSLVNPDRNYYVLLICRLISAMDWAGEDQWNVSFDVIWERLSDSEMVKQQLWKWNYGSCFDILSLHSNINIEDRVS